LKGYKIVAKKQPSTDKKTKPAAKSVSKAAAKTSKNGANSLFSEAGDDSKATKPVAKKSSAAPARSITVEEIGLAAGEVWAVLAAGDDGHTLASLKKAVAAPADLVLLGLGWLAREDKVAIDASARTPTISLK
jgi:hypothetical protein